MVREFGDWYSGRRGQASTGAGWPREVFGKPERLAAPQRPGASAGGSRREEELIAEFAAGDPHGIAVVEAAILIETGSWRRFDRIVLVVCAEEQQIERAIERDGAAARGAAPASAARCRSRRNESMPTTSSILRGRRKIPLRQTRAVYEDLRRIAK